MSALELDRRGVWEWFAAGDAKGRVRDLVARGFAPVVGTDLDGTVWGGDVGDALFVLGIERHWFRAEALPFINRLLDRYGEAPSHEPAHGAARLRELFEGGGLHERGKERSFDADTVTLDYYRLNIACFAGHPASQIVAWSEALFDEEGFGACVFSGARELLADFAAAGLSVVGVSATCELMAATAARRAGFALTAVHGMRPVVQDGLLTGEVHTPLTYGSGKIEVLRQHYGAAPAVGMGDSVLGTDRALLSEAALAIAVEPRGKHQAAALALDPRRAAVLRYR